MNNNYTEIQKNITAYILPEDPSNRFEILEDSLPTKELFHHLFYPEYFIHLFDHMWPFRLDETNFIDNEAVEYVCTVVAKPVEGIHREKRRFLILTQRYLKDAKRLPIEMNPEMETTVMIIRSQGTTMRNTRDILRKQGIPCGAFQKPLVSVVNWSKSRTPDISDDVNYLHFLENFPTDKIRKKVRDFTKPITAHDVYKMVSCVLSECFSISFCGIARKIVLGLI